MLQYREKISHFLWEKLDLETHEPVFGKVSGCLPFLGYLVRDFIEPDKVLKYPQVPGGIMYFDIQKTQTVS